MRTLVVWVPDWPIVAAGQEGLLDAAAPCAVHDGRGLVVVSASGRARGVRTGMKRRHAQRICPELVVISRDEARDARAFEAIMQSVEEVIALPAVLRPGLVLAEASGPARHRGGEGMIAGEVVGAVARLAGAEAYVGIADGLLGGIVAARAGVIVPEGASGVFLAAHPVTALRHASLTTAARAEVDALVEVLTHLGIHTLGDLAGLPIADVAARFGASGVRAHRLASGYSVLVAPGERTVGDVLVARELDPPLERADAAVFATRTLAEELASRLAGRACGRLRVTARTTDGAELSRLWTVDAVIAAGEITDRVRWQLDGWLSGRSGRAPSAPLHMIELVAEEVRGASGVANPLWGSPGHSAAQAERTVVRLQGLIGQEGVVHPVVEGGRDPRSRVRLVAWNDDPGPARRTDAPWPGRLPSPAPSVLLDEPREASLRDSSGRSVTVDARGQISAPPAVVNDGRECPVTAWAGPWPVAERWWDSPRRAAWLQVVVEEGPALLLSTRAGTWQVEGLYD